MNNLRQIRKSKGIGQIEIANALGITQSSYSRYESGLRDIPNDLLQKLSGILDCSIDDILQYEPKSPIGHPVNMVPKIEVETETLIPVVASLRCGFDSAGMPYDFTDKKPVPKSYIMKWGKSIVFNEAVGNSMMPTIRPKDLMVCVPGDSWEDGDIVIIDVNDTDTVKRIYRANDGGIDLVPDNEDYKEMHYTPRDLKDYQIHVLGRVVKVIGPDLQAKPRRRK